MTSKDQTRDKKKAKSKGQVSYLSLEALLTHKPQRTEERGSLRGDFPQSRLEA